MTKQQHDAPDLGSIAGLAAAKKAGALPPRYLQSPPDYEKQRDRFVADHYRRLLSGELKPPGRRIDFEPARGVFTAQRTQGGVPVERPRIVARSARHIPRRAVLSPAGRGRRERRPGQRRTVSASRAGPGGSDSDEPDPPDAAGSLDADGIAPARLSAREALDGTAGTRRGSQTLLAGSERPCRWAGSMERAGRSDRKGGRR
jgi:hypothetical protein